MILRILKFENCRLSFEVPAETLLCFLVSSALRALVSFPDNKPWLECPNIYLYFSNFWLVLCNRVGFSLLSLSEVLWAVYADLSISSLICFPREGLLHIFPSYLLWPVISFYLSHSNNKKICSKVTCSIFRLERGWCNMECSKGTHYKYNFEVCFWNTRALDLLLHRPDLGKPRY